MTGMKGAHEDVAVFGAPMLEADWDERFARMEELTRDKRRVWLLIIGPHLIADVEGQSESWLDEHLYKLQEMPFFSQSSLKAALYLPEVPVYDAVPETMQNSAGVVFGDTIRLAGYDVGEPAGAELALPVTLYWQAVAPTDRRYKYALRLVETLDDGSTRVISLSEREPYDGAIPTIYWDPGKTIVEYSELPPADWPQPATSDELARYRLTLTVYDAETLEPLPITAPGSAQIAADGQSAVLPYRPR